MIVLFHPPARSGAPIPGGDDLLALKILALASRTSRSSWTKWIVSGGDCFISRILRRFSELNLLRFQSPYDLDDFQLSGLDSAT
jgi:hypothetical protein